MRVRMLSLLAACSLAGGSSLVAGTANAADPANPLDPDELRPQIQADVGLAVVGVGYEQPVGKHTAIQAELQIFGTYFLPWFDLGDDVAGVGLGLRGTWFARESGRGLYAAWFARLDRVGSDYQTMTGETLHGTGTAYCAGGMAGWAFGLTSHLDLRLGLGAQYLHYYFETTSGNRKSSTPFVQLDAVLGYRL